MSIQIYDHLKINCQNIAWSKIWKILYHILLSKEGTCIQLACEGFWQAWLIWTSWGWEISPSQAFSHQIQQPALSFQLNQLPRWVMGGLVDVCRRLTVLHKQSCSVSINNTTVVQLDSQIISLFHNLQINKVYTEHIQFNKMRHNCFGVMSDVAYNFASTHLK